MTRTMPAGIENSRSDYSRFVVHLTRDDRSDDSCGQTAIANFKAILDQRCILAIRSHCIHSPKIEQLDKKQQQYFKVACFTETPLHQIRHLTKRIKGRSCNLEPYGFVFRKNLLLSKGAQPATYINGYDGENDTRRAYETAFATGKKTGFKGTTWRMLPYVNAMHSRCDFAWEREWRIVGDFNFELDDLVCAILPETYHGPQKLRLNRLGIAFIDPTWSYERIVEELSKQKCHARIVARQVAKRELAAK